MTFKMPIPEELDHVEGLDIAELIDDIIEYFTVLKDANIATVLSDSSTEDNLQSLEEEYFERNKIYSKLRQEYGKLNFQVNELFTRNTMTGLKLGLLRSKLIQAKSKWEGNIALDFDAAMKLIDHFAETYLLKRSLEEKS